MSKIYSDRVGLRGRLWAEIAFVCFAILPATAMAVKRQETLTCGFADGSKAELRATHEWSMLGAIFKHYGHVQSRSEQSAYAVFFQDTQDRWQSSPGWVRFANPLDGDELHLPSGLSSCARVAKRNGRFMVNRSHLKEDGTWFTVDLSHLQFSDLDRVFPAWVGERLQKIQGASTAGRLSLLAPVAGFLVHEQAISDLSAGSVIRSVYQSVSKDGGQTWSAPSITPQARIFEIGRRLEDQSFVGRPLTFEGRAFPKPVFPVPQTEEERALAIQALPALWREVVTGPTGPMTSR